MTINSQVAMNTLRARLEHIEPVEEGIVRGVKRCGNQPYAVYYIDLSGKIAERADGLAQYQDRVLGKHYFDSDNDLRWNSYLILLADQADLNDAKVARARTTLEGDRNYARKFVIAQEDLASRLDTPVSGGSAPDSALGEVSDALGRWRQLLEPVGLGDTLGDSGIAAVVRSLVETPQGAVPAARRRATSKGDAEIAGKFLEHLQLVQFRPYPTVRELKCGTVNLIRGVNGVGKTTFLEAVEFLFCGSTRRAGVPPKSRVVGRIAGMSRPIDTSDQTQPQVFRDRNLTWYGKRDVTRNNMAASFAVYNFLNTDAAVNLSTGDSPLQVEADLATLLLGPEAARVWARIEQLLRDLPAERRSLERQCESFLSRIKSEQERLATANKSAHESDEIFAQLRADLVQLQWRRPPSSKQEALQFDTPTIAEAESASRRVIDLPELPSRRTMAAFIAARDQNTAWLKSIDEVMTEASTLTKQRATCNESLHRLSVLQDEIKRIRAYFESDYPNTLTRHKHLNDEIADLVRQIGALDPASITVADDQWPEIPMGLWLAELNSHVRDAAEQEANAKRTFDTFKVQKGQLESLRRDLRSTARQLLPLLSDHDSCPLCQTQFPAGTLENRLFGGIPADEGSIELAMTQAMVDARALHGAAARLSQNAETLVQYAARWELPDALTAQQIVEHAVATFAHLAGLQRELSEIIARRAAQQTGGLNDTEWGSLPQTLQLKLGVAIDPLTIDQYSQTTEEQIALQSTQSANCDRRIEELRATALTLRAEAAPEIPGQLKNVREAVLRRLHELESAQDVYRILHQVIAIDENTPLRDVGSALAAASASQERLRLALEAEMAAETSSKEAQATLESAQKNHTVTSAALARVRAAEQALEAIRSQHSREMVSKELLQACRAEVANIFSRIHAPHEFQVSNSAVAPLQRIDTGEPINLNKVSSGQRAAFALSLFLALNARALAAPGIMLIDDPVAHVDDLNTLSFLDYLRDVAASGGRQIFFATADEKLAALFAHKFSFLGNQFNNQLFTRA
jgi:DNA repair protein SbcC/Rad50